MSCAMECGHTKRVHSDDYHNDNANLVACLPCLKEMEAENERLRAALQEIRDGIAPLEGWRMRLRETADRALARGEEASSG